MVIVTISVGTCRYFKNETWEVVSRSMDDVWTVIISFLFLISLLESVELFGYNLRHNALLPCSYSFCSFYREISFMLEELIGQCSEGSAVGLFVGAVHKKMAGASTTARHPAGIIQQQCFDHHHFLPLFFCLASGELGWWQLISFWLAIDLSSRGGLYWLFFGVHDKMMAVLLWRRRLFVWRMMAIMRACAKSTGASGSATRGIRQRMAVRTSRNRCDLKIWIRKEHHQRSYLVHLNLCSHLFYVLRPRALLHISQLHMLSDILLHNILHEHTDGV